MKKKFFLISFLLFSYMGFSQSAEVVSDVIGTSRVTYGQVAYLCGTSVGVLADEASYDEAVDVFKQAGLINGDISANDAIPLDAVAYLVVNTWNMKPCLMYKMFHSKRYALHTLKGNGLVPQSRDPKRVSTGHDILFIITRCIERFDVVDASAFLGGAKK